MTRWQAALRRPQPPQWWRFALWAVCVPLMLGALASWLGVEQRGNEALRRATEQSAERQIAMLGAMARLTDAETSQRGYVITGSQQFLELYVPARREVDRSVSALSQAFTDRPEQARRLAAFREIASAKFVEMDGVIATRESAGLTEGARRVAEGLGKRLMDRARQLSDQIVQVERQEAGARSRAFAEQRQTALVLGWTMVAVTTLVLVAGLYLVWRQRRERYAADLQTFEASVRNRAILDSTADAIAILNPSGSIETINASARALTGFTIADLKQRDVTLLFDPPGRDGSFLERIGLEGGALRQPVLTDRIVRTRSGGEVPVDIALGVMHLASGDHIVASLRDVTERKRMERIKDDLISTVSHELRTPLTTIVGALGLLRSAVAAPLPESAAKLVRMAEANSARLIRIINDMLDIDRLDAGKLKIDKRRLDLRDVVRRAQEANAGFRERGVRVSWAAPETPVMVTADQDRLLQVIGNLVSNAKRASPPGGEIVVVVEARRDGALVAVDDRGAGVPEAFRERIFGRFERAPGQDAPGTGLGLAISREIVAAHEGRIWFEDRDGGGTRFAFLIPYAAQAPGVLICEGEPAVAAKLASLTEADGFRAVIATSPEEARRRLADEDLIAIIVDVEFSKHHGVALARAVRDGEDRHDLPIIMLAAQEPKDWASSTHVDFVDWLEKPVDRVRLTQAIRSACARSDGEAPAILHLDDDRDMLAVTAAALGAEARILSARSIEEAHAILAAESVALAIIDLHLEGASGLDLLPALVDARGVAIPTILYSGQRIGVEAAGKVDAVLVKAPGSLPDLKATIHRMLQRAEAPSEALS